MGHSMNRERKMNRMDDLISRQAAIDAVSRGCQEFRGIFAECEKNLNELSPAQPEIIRCKDCKWKNKHNCTRAVEVFITDEKYCAWAERRTDEQTISE